MDSEEPELDGRTGGSLGPVVPPEGAVTAAHPTLSPAGEADPPASVLLTRRRHGEGSPHGKGQCSWSWFSPSEDSHPGPLPHRADMGNTGGPWGRGRTDNWPCPVLGCPAWALGAGACLGEVTRAALG